jgi:hypothetical protein
MVSGEGVQGSANNVASSAGPAESDDSGGETWHVTRSIVERALTQPSEARRVAACVAILGIQTENALGATTASAQTLLPWHFQSLIGARQKMSVSWCRRCDCPINCAMRRSRDRPFRCRQLLAESGAVSDGLIHAVPDSTSRGTLPGPGQQRRVVRARQRPARHRPDAISAGGEYPRYARPQAWSRGGSFLQ